MDASEAEVFEALAALDRRFDDLMSLFDQDRGLRPVSRRRDVQRLYAELKDDLRAEGKRLGNSSASLTNAERRWYASVVHEALGHLSAPVTARPENIFSSLYDGACDVSHMLAEMRSFFGLPVPDAPKTA